MVELIDVTIPGQKKSYPLKDITIIGRASTTDIKFDDLLVSRHHARICKSASGYLIEDLGSHNGVFLGSERITSPHPLTNGEKICIGPYTLIFNDTESGQPYPSEFPSTECTQIIMATKDPLPVETMDETIGRETPGKGEFERLQKRLKIFHDITRVIGNIFDLDALLKEIIQIIFTVLPHAGRCFVALQDSDETQLTIRTIQTKDVTAPPHLNLPHQGGGIQGDNEYSPPLVGGVRGGGELFTYDEISSQFSAFVKISLEKLPLSLNTSDYTFHVKSADNFPHNIQAIASEFNTVIEAHARTIVFCNNIAEEQRFQEIIHDLRIESNKQPELLIGRLSKGFQFSDIQIAILAHHEIFHRYKQRREVKKPIQTRAIDSFVDLKKGDYVVHISHGIGRFLGMETLEEEGYKREYLIIEYDNGTKIYVPATKIEVVQKYIGSSDHSPRLDKIGAKYWEIRKKRAENAVTDIASDLLHMQALRNAKEGIVYPKDTDWQREFEAEFIYDETPDQIQVINDIKKDMESKRPMDRLICGDVGYGKTEIAIRAAFKSVMFGKQVAVLVPTTILAQQHFTTFSERMADYPVKVDVLSRFKTRKEQKEALEKTSAGLVDILIGTHRLLQKDVYFKDLGLVIIDEEQRFGVEHKERLKKFRQMVDVLTLTATPIPRTLHMSLMGIKDISSLNTPPLGRQAIHTQIIRYDPERIRQAIRLELNRDGQVYFVHNRVYNIEQIASNLSEIVTEA